MPVNKVNILKSPLEKSIKSIATADPFRFSKNVHSLSEKKISADLFPVNSETCQQLSFNFKPSTSYLSFRESLHLQVFGKIIVKTTDPDGAIKNFHLSEDAMNIYLNDGFSKFVKGVKTTFNNHVTLDTSTLSFMDLNTFEIYSAIETSFLKSTDEFKKSNLMNNDIISQLELDQIKSLVTGEVFGDIEDITTSRKFSCSIPTFPFRLYPSFFKNRLKSAANSNADNNLPTVCVS